jgi:tRNA (guanine10-N2)-dimethyltransferase
LKLVAEYLGGSSDISRAEIRGLLKSYGGNISGEMDKLIFFSTDHPEKIVSRVAFSKRIGKIIDWNEQISIGTEKRYAIREKRNLERESLIEQVAKRIDGRVDLGNPDVIFYIYNFNEPVITETIYERKMNVLLDQKYKTKPMNHPSSISPILARGMINIAGLKEGDVLIDPFAGTGTYLIEGFRMGIESYGIDRSWKMVEGGNLNLKHFGFPTNIKQGDFSELVSFPKNATIVTDPPYGRGAKIFSQSRESLYSRFFSLISGTSGVKVFCIPTEELVTLAKEYMELKIVGEIRVHSSLTRRIAISM